VSDVVPFLRVRDAEASAAWYERLGFEIEWTHRFEEGLPLFVSIVKAGESRIFLSEHEGDARPDTLLYLYVDDLDAIAGKFGAPIHTAEYGMREVELTDPDGNRLRVGSPAPA
jgi:catechol 2,3-dioxygenase-like lactoylglutathione lyase family enzyme